MIKKEGKMHVFPFIHYFLTVKNHSMNAIKYIILLSLSILVLSTGNVFAQQSMGGNLMIQNQGGMSIYGHHNFDAGSGFINPGMIYTDRTKDGGFLDFGEGSSWSGATKGRFIDGFVRVGHRNAFTFPIGHKDLYRPVSISGAKHTTAAYFSVSLEKAFTKTTLNGLNSVSNTEYWEVYGEERTQISFFWGKESNISQLTGGQLDQLTIVGWKNDQWNIIPSEVLKTFTQDLTNLDNSKTNNSNFDAGVIRTKLPIKPNDYDYFTIGAVGKTLLTTPSIDDGIISIFPNPVVKELTVDLDQFRGKVNSILIYNVEGKEMAYRVLDQNAAKLQQFDASNYVSGLYKVHIKVNDQTHTTSFVVGRK